MRFHWSAGLVIRSRALVNWSLPSLVLWSDGRLIRCSANPLVHSAGYIYTAARNVSEIRDPREPWEKSRELSEITT